MCYINQPTLRSLGYSVNERSQVMQLLRQHPDSKAVPWCFDKIGKDGRPQTHCRKVASLPKEQAIIKINSHIERPYSSKVNIEFWKKVVKDIKGLK